MGVGERLTLPRTVSDASGVERGPASWSASDASIANVSADGALTALAAGTTTLFANFCDTTLAVSLTATLPPPVDVPDVDASPRPEPRPHWQEVLFSAPCESPCFGGSACGTADEARVNCLSGVTCLLGGGQEIVEPSGAWAIHLSAVLDVGLQDPCHKVQMLWVCRQGSDRCIAQSDACENAKRAVAFSNAVIPVTVTEIADQKVILDVREGGPGGSVLATTRALPVPSRSGICNGFGVLVPEAQTVTGTTVDGPPRISKITYFLLPADSEESRPK
jgi:hypothetical protein